MSRNIMIALAVLIEKTDKILVIHLVILGVLLLVHSFCIVFPHTFSSEEYK